MVGDVAAGGLDAARLGVLLHERVAASSPTPESWGLGPDAAPLDRYGATPLDLDVVFTDDSTGQEWSRAGSSLGLEVDIKATVAEAMASGRERANVFSALLGLVRCSTCGVRLLPVVSLDGNRLREFLLTVAPEVTTLPANASLDPDTGEPREGRPGRLLDLERTEAGLRLEAARAAVQPVLRAAGLTFPLVFQEVAPRGDVAVLAGLDRERLARFSTPFDETERGRAWNIGLSAALLDGAVIQPGGLMSFNGVVGPRDAEHGFREAPEIVENELVPGVGGGVCQVATTVFNAALLADLAVAERYHHSRPLTYIPLGRDATLAYPSLDLVIRNSRAFSVILTARASGGELEVSFWGRRVVPLSVSLETEELNLRPAECAVELSPDIEPGGGVVVDPPFHGRDVRLWREVVQDGVMIRRELIWVDHYEPIPGLVRVGPTPAPASSGAAGTREQPGPSTTVSDSRGTPAHGPR